LLNTSTIAFAYRQRLHTEFESSFSAKSIQSKESRKLTLIHLLKLSKKLSLDPKRMSLAANGKASPPTGATAAAIIQNWTASQQQQQRHHSQHQHQQQQQHQPDHHQNSSTNSTTPAGRRLLPSPVLKQVTEASIQKIVLVIINPMVPKTFHCRLWESLI
jgi:hypothetical protein